MAVQQEVPGCADACLPCAHPGSGPDSAGAGVPCRAWRPAWTRRAGWRDPSHASVSRGRSFSTKATAAKCSGPCARRSVPLGGRYWRSNPLVFSLLGRCHGECGSQRNTGIPSSCAISACSAVSRPWSQVNDRRSSTDSCATVATSAARTSRAPRRQQSCPPTPRHARRPSVTMSWRVRWPVHLAADSGCREGDQQAGAARLHSPPVPRAVAGNRAHPRGPREGNGTWRAPAPLIRPWT